MPAPVLPNWVKKTLPEAAQDIFMQAFEAALNQPYHVPGNQIEKKTHEEAAQEAGWKAVQEQFHLHKGLWVARPRKVHS